MGYRSVLCGSRPSASGPITSLRWRCGTPIGTRRACSRHLSMSRSASLSAQMDRWCRDFDNWAIVDTACFALFDRTPHAWAKVAQWADSRDEWVKRAAFALLWSLTVHDRVSGDQPFLRALALIERGAADDRHFVSKAVNMALRATGKRSAALNAAAIATAQRLATSTDAAPRWVGQHALRELTVRFGQAAARGEAAAVALNRH